MASLFGIPADRMKVPKIVAGSAVVDMEIDAPSPCAGVVCGVNGFCYEGTLTLALALALALTLTLALALALALTLILALALALTLALAITRRVQV
jgi:hypothetical protein